MKCLIGCVIMCLAGTLLYGQQIIVHIGKTYPDDSPREVLYYGMVNGVDSAPQLFKRIEYRRDGQVSKVEILDQGFSTKLKTTTDQISEEMNDIREMISDHVQTVNMEFRDNLYKLELNFIGREKHLKAAQDSIANNRSFTKKVRGNLKRKIENVKGDLESFERKTESDFEDVASRIEKTKSDLSSFKRITRRSLNDRGRDITTLQKDIELIQEKIEKLKESAFKED